MKAKKRTLFPAGPGDAPFEFPSLALGGGCTAVPSGALIDTFGTSTFPFPLMGGLGDGEGPGPVESPPLRAPGGM